jgi:hypothetical protein
VTEIPIALHAISCTVISQVGERLKTALGLQKRLKMDKRAETIEAAREFYAGRAVEREWPFKYARDISELMADFHLSQSRDAWTPIHGEGDLPNTEMARACPDCGGELASTTGVGCKGTPLPTPYEQEK